jgi:hypothetical protein
VATPEESKRHHNPKTPEEPKEKLSWEDAPRLTAKKAVNLALILGKLEFSQFRTKTNFFTRTLNMKWESREQET